MSRGSWIRAACRRSRIGATRASRRLTVVRSRSRWSASNSGRATRSIAALVGTPVLLEVADERRAEVAGRLLAGVDRHVLPERVQRLLADPQRPPVRDADDRAGARQLPGARFEPRVHLLRRDDLVGQAL